MATYVPPERTLSALEKERARLERRGTRYIERRILSLIEIETGSGASKHFKYYTLDGAACVTPEERTEPCLVCGKPLPPRQGRQQFVCSQRKNSQTGETRCQRVYRIAREAGIPIDEAKRYVGGGRGTKRGQKQ